MNNVPPPVQLTMSNAPGIAGMGAYAKELEKKKEEEVRNDWCYESPSPRLFFLSFPRWQTAFLHFNHSSNPGQLDCPFSIVLQRLLWAFANFIGEWWESRRFPYFFPNVTRSETIILLFISYFPFSTTVSSSQKVVATSRRREESGSTRMSESDRSF